MNVIDPNNASHVIKVIPRYYNITNAHTFSLYDEDLRTSTSLSQTRTIADGYINYTVSITTSEGKSYSVKITDDITGNVVYRGKIFATAQTTQDYQIN